MWAMSTVQYRCVRYISVQHLHISADQTSAVQDTSVQYGKSMKAATATRGCGRAAHVVLEGTAGPQEQLHRAPLVASPFGLCLQPLRGLQVVYVQAGLQHLHISARARQAPRLASVPSSLSAPWAQQALELCACPICVHRVAPEPTHTGPAARAH